MNKLKIAQNPRNEEHLSSMEINMHVKSVSDILREEKVVNLTDSNEFDICIFQHNSCNEDPYDKNGL